MSAGDFRELSIIREEIPDGAGGEKPGLAIRIWVESPDEGDVDLAATFLLPDGPHAWAAQARELVDTALQIAELDR